MKLTGLELKVLRALYESAEGNGQDFGFIEDARKSVGKANQLSGVIASLVKKGLIEVHGSVNPGDKPEDELTQFTWVGDSSESYENAQIIRDILTQEISQ